MVLIVLLEITKNKTTISEVLETSINNHKTNNPKSLHHKNQITIINNSHHPISLMITNKMISLHQTIIHLTRTITITNNKTISQATHLVLAKT